MTLDAPTALPVELTPAAINATTDRVELSGAGAEWLDFVALQSGPATTVRLMPLRRGDGPSGQQPLVARVYRIVDVPADTNRAGYLRLYGGTGGRATVPRALVPLQEGADGFRLPAGGPNRLWIDVQLPRALERGRWTADLEALDANGRVMASLPITLEAHGFDLPAERRLTIGAELSWDRLVALWPETFRGVGPARLARNNARAAPAVERLDELAQLAQADRLQVTVPALGATVKWPAGRPPEADWRDYDSMVLPWLTGAAFADGIGFRHWPVPRMPHLDGYPEAARREYWQAALSHLADVGVLDRVVIGFDEADAGADSPFLRRGAGLTPAEWLRLSREAGRLAEAYPLGQIALPLEADQVRFTGPDNPGLFPPEQAGRLVVRAEGLVTDRPARPWPAGLPRPGVYLDLDGPTPVEMPDGGAAEADVRLLGWLAFLRGATHVETGSALSEADGATAIDPTRLVWFHRGEAFGHDGPVPSVQLKWLRRAQQDYEYLALAADRLEEAYARVIARALVRPVRVRENEPVDPVLPLIAGEPHAAAWREGLDLVAGRIATSDEALRRNLPLRFSTDHTHRTTAWLAPRERPLPIVSAARWDLVEDAAGERLLNLRLGVSVYNPSDARPEGMSVSFVEMPGGASAGGAGGRTWQDPGVLAAPSPATYEVGRFPIATSATVDALGQQFRTFTQAPLRVAVGSQFSGATATAGAVTPATVLDRRGEDPIVDGVLGEWSGNEAIADGPLVQMHDRPAIQAGAVARTQVATRAFAAWTPEGLYVAFRFEGAPPAGVGGGAGTGVVRASRNFVDTEYRRVWGEDACELLVQPVWLDRGDPTDGPLLHVVCKPDGAFARRRGDRRASAELWRNFESGLRYAATTDAEGVWRAEVLIPWSALRGEGMTLEQVQRMGEVPALVRFNLSHHDAQTGRSASWAGPVDHGREEQFTGALVLRHPERVGFSSPP